MTQSTSLSERMPLCVLPRIAGFLLLMLILPGCSPKVDDVPPGGLLENPGFEDHEGSGIVARPWSFSQHAGDTSYRVRVEEGVLRIERIGNEPWGQITQQLSPEDVAAHTGAIMEFSVDISADLTDEFGEPMSPTGPSVGIWGYADDTPPHLRGMLGSSLLLSERSPIDLGPGTHDWQRHVIRFQVPDNATRLEVAVAMTLGGEIRVRDPHLAVVDGAR